MRRIDGFGYAPAPGRRLAARTLAPMVATAVLLSSCDVPSSSPEEIQLAQQVTLEHQYDVLDRHGIRGRHALSAMQAASDVESSSSVNATVNGSAEGFYFLIAGAAEGQIEGSLEGSSSTTTERFVRIAWQSNTEQSYTSISEFPIDKIKVVEDPEALSPEVEFGYNINVLPYYGDRQNGACWYDDDPTDQQDPGYRPELCMRTTDYATANEFLEHPGFLTFVKFYMTPDDARALYSQINGT